MSYLDDEYYDFAEFQRLMEETTAKLKRMNMIERAMRWQYGEPGFYVEFIGELDEANGWVSSHC